MVVSVIGLTLLWPVLHGLISWLRFGRPWPTGPVDLGVFLPMGLVAALTFLFFWNRAMPGILFLLNWEFRAELRTR